MTVNELIEALEGMRDDGYGETKVMARYNYGDYCRTQALVAFDCVENIVPYETPYSSSGLAMPKGDDDSRDDDNQDEVIVLH